MVRDECLDGFLFTLSNEFQGLQSAEYVENFEKACSTWGAVLDLYIAVERDEQGQLIFEDPSTASDIKNLVRLRDLSGIPAAGLTTNLPQAGVAQDGNDLLTTKVSISINTTTNWQFECEGPLLDGNRDLQGTILHELGHALGLAHAVRYDWNETTQTWNLVKNEIMEEVVGIGPLSQSDRPNLQNTSGQRSISGALDIVARSRNRQWSTETQQEFGIQTLGTWQNGAEPITPLEFNTNVDPASDLACQDGSIDLTVVGGSGSYIFLWENGETTEDLVNIMRGKYGVTITDLSCGDIIETTIFVPVDKPVGIGHFQNITSCGLSSSCDGELEIHANDLDSYSYVWIYPNGDYNYSAGIYDLCDPGNYRVTVTNSQQCQFIFERELCCCENEGGSESTCADGFIFPLVIESSDILNISGSSQGAINLTMDGGLDNLVFQWSGVLESGQSFTSTDEDLINLEAGEYCVTITDGCSALVIECFTIANCNDILALGSSTSTACGEWRGGEIITWFIHEVDERFISYQWGTGETTSSIENLEPGSYSVTVFDAESGCTSSSLFYVEGVESPEFTIQTTVNTGAEGQASILLDVIGGGILSFHWSNGSEDRNQYDLFSGEYQVTVSNDLGCEIIESFTVSNYDCPTTPELTLAVSGLSPGQGVCDLLGQITGITISGSAGPYTLNVRKEDNIEGTYDETFVYQSPVSNQTITNVPEGRYILTLSDGCGEQEVVKTLDLCEFCGYEYNAKKTRFELWGGLIHLQLYCVCGRSLWIFMANQSQDQNKRP